MSLASPLALLWLAALVPVVVFYVLKVRLRRVPVSTLLFWRQIYDEHKPRSLWQRLRYWLSLLAQILLILLLVGALADPVFTWETRQARRVVLILDNSASMNATDVSPSRLAAAKSEALRIINGLRVRDELAVVTAGGPPKVACGFSSHRRTLSSAVNDVSKTDQPTRMAEAIELTQRVLGGQHEEQHREIIVLTDGANRSSGGSPEFDAKPQPGGKAVESPALRFIRFGTNAGNVGITQFQVRRSLVDPLGYEILLEVSNASDEPVECRLDIDLDDAVIDVFPLKLTPGQQWTQSIEKTSANGGILTAKLDRADVLDSDNRVWALLPKREPLPITLVSEGNLFIQKVLEANPLVVLSRVEPAAWKPGDASGLTVFHRHVPTQLPNGPVLVIDPRGDCDLWHVGDPLPNPIVTQHDKDSPLMRHVRLDNVVMPEARRVQFASDEGVKTLAASGNDPLFVALERPGSKLLLLSVNLDEGDLPLRTAFPILMMNALNWFTDNRGELRESAATGAVMEIANPRRTEGVSPLVGQSSAVAISTRRLMPPVRLELVAPGGRHFALPIPSDHLSLGPFDQCGVWRVVTADGAGETPLLELACNLVDRNESDVRVPSSDEATPTSVSSASLFGNRPVCFWLIAFAWLLTAVEWWAYQRRVIA